MDGQRSDGRVEFCAGEVDDASALIDEMRQNPRFHDAPLALIGFSHGGCVAMRLAQKRSDVRAVALFSAPVETASLYHYLSGHWWRHLFFDGWLAGQIRQFVGATPEQNPGAYEARSPLRHMAHFSAPLLAMHGLADDIVPIEQAYQLRDSLRAMAVNVSEATLSTQCKQINPRDYFSKAGPETTARTAQFLFLKGQGHTYSPHIHTCAEARAIEFVTTQLTTPKP